jgi:hypothetical protein
MLARLGRMYRKGSILLFKLFGYNSEMAHLPPHEAWQADLIKSFDERGIGVAPRAAPLSDFSGTYFLQTCAECGCKIWVKKAVRFPLGVYCFECIMTSIRTGRLSSLDERIEREQKEILIQPRWTSSDTETDPSPIRELVALVLFDLFAIGVAFLWFQNHGGWEAASDDKGFLVGCAFLAVVNLFTLTVAVRKGAKMAPRWPRYQY